MAEYKLKKGGMHEKFFASRKKVQGIGGGYANGKTAAVCIRTLEILRDYPGANILMGRATYPKLKDTLRKEFFKWCPPSWIKRMPTEKDNTCILVNGSVINFRYVQQRGKSTEEDTSNLLSATYDLIVIDQLEDPEFSQKDLLDLLGRLRGSTPYRGNDPTMPMSGPRWFIFTTNPTSNWVYQKLVKPYHVFVATGRKSEGLLLDEHGELLMEMFEGSTYENAHALPADAISLLESAYTGQYRERYLMGKWAAYDGLVYRDFDYEQHVVPHSTIEDYLYGLYSRGINVDWLQGYDYGMAVPSCYLKGFVDHQGNVVIADGFYEKELNIAQQARKIEKIDRQYAHSSNPIHADPQIFRRIAGSRTQVGKTIAEMFYDEGIRMQRGQNDKLAGITKINSYLAPVEHHRNPFNNNFGAPRLYVSGDLDFLTNEFANYRWRKNPLGDREDDPVDKDDHAMDALKYLMSPRTMLATLVRKARLADNPHMRMWYEPPDEDEPAERHGLRASRYR